MGPNPSSGPRNSATRQETSTAPVAVRDIEALRHRGRGALDGDLVSSAQRLQLLAVYRFSLAGGKHSPGAAGRNVVFVGAPRSPKGRARETIARLALEYPGRARELCALEFETPFQLLVATILSAQTTDERVNSVTPALFQRYPAAADLAAADPEEVEALIRPTGFFRNKTRSLVGMAQALEERFGGEVPRRLEELVTLPGVGRKTANVVRSVAFDLPGLPVDTHVGRLSRRLGLTTETDPVKAELALNAMVPADERGALSLRLILHGRRVCVARTRRCEDCVLSDFCPSSLLRGGKR
ncbi:MAG: endonuclease III [Acidimicrobiia bacterium]|nr:endonuclease III [Acidimicrobiia bacterium]